MTAAVEALGYVGIEVSDLAAWKAFASAELGFQWCEREDGSVDLRMDNYAYRIRLHEGPLDDYLYAGWEVADPAALDGLVERLEAAGVEVEAGDDELAADRRVHKLVRFKDPEGNRHEAFYGPLQKTNDPFVSPRGVTFKTGTQGLGHLVFSCGDAQVMTEFFIGLLGFKLSDYINTEVVPGRPLKLTFLRCNGRHHTLALAPVPIKKKIVHLMAETNSIDDVGRALDRCLKAKRHLSFTLGRHSNDEMISFYPLTPSGFDFEYGWGGLEVHDESWHVLTHDTNSAWGHKFQLPPRPPKPE